MSKNIGWVDGGSNEKKFVAVKPPINHEIKKRCSFVNKNAEPYPVGEFFAKFTGDIEDTNFKK